eukprot:gene38932-48074_t
MEQIRIRGARTHNLKNINLDLPRNKLIVITGLSGSGKSSLAFDTLYAEGQRRYVESLSAYARQFLQLMEKPDVDLIEGLSPAISIEQKATSHNPRSTVGTVTEIHDYLRLLFARVGTPYCINHPTHALAAQTVSQMVDAVLAMPEGTKLMILAPVVANRKGEHVDLFEQMQAQGFVRFRVQSGTHDAKIYEVDDLPKLKKTEKHTIDVVIDRVKVTPEIKQRLAESFETALRLADGRAVAYEMDTAQEHVYSNKFACTECGYSLQELEPRLFSFNNPMGACPECDGLGHIEFFDPKRIVAFPNLSLASGAVKGWDRRNQYYFLRDTTPPPVAALRAAGVPMAVATDNNPGTSPMTSLLLAMNMVCTLWRLTPLEALAGCTVHAARALGRQADIGTLEVGKRADFAVLEDDPLEIAPDKLKDVRIWGTVQGGHVSGAWPGGRLPVTVIGGYLGTGKTTLVNRLLRAADGQRLAVLVNDFGATPIDRDLIVSSSGDTLEISGGCICCSYGSDLMDTLMTLPEQRPDIERVVLETSGVALPGMVASAVTLLPAYRVDGIVVMVDVETVRTMADDAYLGDTITRQLAAADLVIANRCDLVDEASLQETLAWLATQSPAARLIPATRAEIAPDLLLGLRDGAAPRLSATLTTPGAPDAA